MEGPTQLLTATLNSNIVIAAWRNRTGQFNIWGFAEEAAVQISPSKIRWLVNETKFMQAWDTERVSGDRVYK